MDVGTFFARRCRGLTLIELTTSIAVVAVSLALIAPNLHGVAQRSRVTSAANQLLTDLRFARTNAVTRRQMVSLCPSNDGNQCSGDPLGWHHGYIVFADSNGNRRREPQDPLEFLR